MSAKTSNAKRVAPKASNAAALKPRDDKAKLGLIAPLAFQMGVGRAATVGAIMAYCGKAPKGFDYATKADTVLPHKAFRLKLKAARAEYVVGHIAGSYPAYGNMTTADAIEAARGVVLLANANGTGDLKKGQLGRRNAEQERAYANARQYASELFKAAGYAPPAPTKTASGATKKRAPHHNDTADKEGASKPEAETLTAAKMTPEIATAHIVAQAASLLRFANKHAAKLPVAYGEAVHHFQSAIMAVAKG